MQDAFDQSVSARAAVLIEAKSGRVIWEKNSQQQLPMASTTKIMTALLTLSQPDLHDVFTVSSKAIAVEGTSMGLRSGDKASLYALAVGMLTVSGNDGANAAAVRIAGSTKKFARLMNQKADELGMVNTNFVTPSGLDASEHYSTAYDMALLGAAAIENPLFLSICSARATAVEYGNPAYTRVLTNSNRLLRSCEGCIGVKTGYTSKAGRCLVSAVQRDGVTLVCVTLNAPDDWNDHQKLYDYGFKTLETVRVLPEAMQYDVDVAGTGQQVALLPQGSVSVTVLRGEAALVTQR
ncbi:MAG: D-alanyl-D-alanine carboxypeptidase, partial [Clostridia bacterium]|nr:D-alanyl-D-alanine carboxypeptidase [Clostridia bacterium]